MINHSDEILSRPARTWFQNPQQKKAAAAAALPGDQLKRSSHTDSDRNTKRAKTAVKAKRNAREEDTPEELRVCTLTSS